MAIQSRHNISIYTDGACKKVGHGGASSFLLIDEKIIAVGLLASAVTTNNHMEMTATILGLVQALEYLKDENCVRDASITVYTDSQYVQKGISEWMINWKKRGWRTAGGDPVLNKNLWVEFDTLYTAMKKKFHRVEIKWIKGHNGNAGNEIADFLATAAYPALSSPDDTLLLDTLEKGLPKIVNKYWPDVSILPLTEILYTGVWIEDFKDESKQTQILKEIISNEL